MNGEAIPNLGSITILSGPVGAGKTTVARELVASSPAATVYIEGDAFWSFIVKPAEDRAETQRLTMLMRAMLAAARHFARDDYDVIVDFSIPPWYVDAVRKLLAGGTFDYVVLRPSEAVCAARAAARPQGTITDYARYRELYASFDDAGRFTIRDDASDAATLAARIRAGLDAGSFRVS